MLERPSLPGIAGRHTYVKELTIYGKQLDSSDLERKALLFKEALKDPTGITSPPL